MLAYDLVDLQNKIFLKNSLSKSTIEQIWSNYLWHATLLKEQANMVELINGFTESYRARLQNRYDHMVSDYFNGDPFTALLLPIMLTANISYWIVAIGFTLLNQHEGRLFERYRIRTTKKSFEADYLWRMAANVFMNQVASSLFTYPLALAKYYTVGISPVLPTASRFCLEWLFFVFTREAGYYYIHRAMHSPLLYRFFHRQHHKQNYPIAIGTIYGNPIDNLLSNFVPIFVGPIVMNSHVFTIALWFHYVLITSIYEHSGHNFLFSIISSEFHDFHHNCPTNNFGENGLFDWLHGTDKTFRNSIYFKKNKIHFRLDPSENQPK